MGSKINKMTAIEIIRMLSGMFHPEYAVAHLATINVLARYILGLVEEGFAVEEAKEIGIDLILEVRG